MHVAVILIKGKPKGHAEVVTGPLAVVGYCNPQCGRRCGPFLNRHVFNPAGFINRCFADDCLHITVQAVHAQGRAQTALMGVVIGSGTCASGKPVHGSGTRPGAAEHIVGSRIQQCTRLCTIPKRQVHIVNKRRRAAGHIVPADTARRGCVKGIGRRIVVGRLDRLQSCEIPNFGNF